MGIMDVFARYPASAPIVERRGDAFRWGNDRIRLIKSNDGSEYFEMKGNKYRLPVSSFTQMSMDKRGNTVIPLYSPENGVYLPMTVSLGKKRSYDLIDKETGNIVQKDFQTPELTTFSTLSEWGNWNVLEKRRQSEIYRKKEGFWSKIAPYAILLMTGGILLFTVIQTTSTMEAIAETVATVGRSTAEPLAQAVNRLADIMANMPKG